MDKGGNIPCVLNAANEIAVESFLNDKIGFLAISEVIEKCLEKAEFIAKPSLNDYIDVDFATRAMAKELIAKES